MLQNKNKEKAWKDRSNEVLRERKSKYRVFSTLSIMISLIFLFIIISIGVSAFIYFGFNDYFKPLFVDNSSCVNECAACPECPDLNCPNLHCPEPNISINFDMPHNLDLNILSINITNSS